MPTLVVASVTAPHTHGTHHASRASLHAYKRITSHLLHRIASLGIHMRRVGPLLLSFAGFSADCSRSSRGSRSAVSAAVQISFRRELLLLIANYIKASGRACRLLALRPRRATPPCRSPHATISSVCQPRILYIRLWTGVPASDSVGGRSGSTPLGARASACRLQPPLVEQGARSLLCARAARTCPRTCHAQDVFYSQKTWNPTALSASWAHSLRKLHMFTFGPYKWALLAA
jgi:hypothetical protein